MLKIYTIAFMCCLLQFIGSKDAHAQNSALSSGGNGNGDGGTFSYSVGLTGYETAKGQSGSSAAGLQHARVSVLTGTQYHEITLEAKLHPNPASELVTLTLPEGDFTGYSYTLQNVAGAELLSESITSGSTSLNLENLTGNTFLLRVLKNNLEIKTFKIVKNF